MLSEISVGNTQSEVLGALGFESVDDLETNYEQMLSDIDVSYGDSKITLANSIWMKQYEINEDVKNVVAGIEEKMDCEFFIKDTIDYNEVNQWVETKTNGLITDMMESFDKDIALINTLYYKSVWEIDIRESGEKEDFFLKNGRAVDVNYLFARREKMFYKVDDKYTYVEVPLDEGKLLLALPNEDVEVNELLETNTLNSIMATATNNSGKKYGLVNIDFPKFEIEYTVEKDSIEKTLEEKGVNELYEIPHMVSGIEAKEVEVVQKTKFIVDEEGIEATAVTGVYIEEFGGGDIIEVDLEIIYDRPFLYVLI